MKTVLVILGLTIASVSAYEPGVRVKFDVPVLRNGFSPIPTTYDAAIDEGWTNTTGPSNMLSSMELLCRPNDYYICAFYDNILGNILGLQISLDHKKFEPAFDMDTLGFYNWTLTVGGTTSTHYATKLLYVSPDILAQSVEVRIANYNNSAILQEDGNGNCLWLTGFNGAIDAIPCDETAIQETLFKKQNCIIMMGQHYFYNMTTEIECRSDTLYPWFLVYSNGKSIGGGMVVFGTLTLASGDVSWIEHTSKFISEVVIPYASPEYYKLNKFGLTLHTYAIDTPWTIGC